MAKAKGRSEVLFKPKPKKSYKGVHSKNNKPAKKYRGQGRK